MACPIVSVARVAGAASSAAIVTANATTRTRGESLKASASAPTAPTTITSGPAHDNAPDRLPSTTSSVTTPAMIASGAAIRPMRSPDSACPTPAPTSIAAHGARNET
ncbi:MAG: hypothetical protein ACR2NR_12385 [Solirubrobacteraceae bacterium]